MSKVKLTVRTPTSKVNDDFDVDCGLDWSVAQVKNRIREQMDQHPEPADQRLVYGGKLLQDHDTLGQILRLDEEVESYTVHLVCKQLHVEPTMASHNAPNSSNNDSTTETDGLRQRNVNQSETANSQESQSNSASHNMYSDPMSWAAAFQQQMFQQQQQELLAGNAQTTPEQVWAQNMNMYGQYMQQYMQYMQQFSTAGAATMATVATAAAAQNPAAFFPPAAAANGPAAVPQAAHAPAGGEAQPGLAAQGPVGQGPQVMDAAGPAGGALGAGMAAAADDDDGGEAQERDVLDWLYICSRMLILVSIVYFYSSFTRFTVVFGCGFIAYLWNYGYFNQQQPQNAAAAPEEAAAAAGEAAVNEGEDAAEDASVEENDAAEESPEVAEPAVPGPVETAATFIRTFFSSLVPGQPQAV